MLKLAGQLATSTQALWRGTAVRVSGTPRPQGLLHLYDMEGCPHCRLVREALTELDLDAVIYPCPKGGDRFRNRAVEISGQERFPLLVDPEEGEVLQESTRIVSHLWRQYGDGRVSGVSSWRPVAKTRSVLASATRFGSGIYARPARRPERLLELYSFESSPYTREVRERLCELQLPYVLRNCGRSTPADYVLPVVRDAIGMDYEPATVNRLALKKQTGRVAIPYLVDPNQNIGLYESDRILEHLHRHYQI